MKITFSASAGTGKAKAKHAIVVTTTDALTLGTEAKAIDKATKGAVAKALKSSRFNGKAGECLSVAGVDGVAGDRVVVLGLGKAKEFDAIAAENAGGQLVAHLNGVAVKSAELILDTVKGAKIDDGEAAARAAFGAYLRAYRFDKYRTKLKDDEKPSLGALKLVSAGTKAAKEAYAELEKVADGVYLARDVVNEPGNVIYPETLADECKKLTDLGVKVEVLNEAKMKKLGMGALLGVGQGSVRESQLVVMRWEGGKKSDQPVAFVGKGVTFDTGGISIKPSNGMEEMKFDMGGSGTVIGLMKALAGRKATANVVGVVGLVENMPDGNAQRPGDIVTSMSGQTIEVLNTDAEGRLVLADALWYTQDRFKPQFMINLATLTGAILVALGDTRAGVFSNNDELCDKLNKASEKTGEKLWRLPLGDEYDKMIDSPVADMQNIGADRIAGSITAGQFLQRFVNDVPWAHLDIAGTGWTKKDQPTTPKGATAYGVRLLNTLVQDFYEK